MRVGTKYTECVGSFAEVSYKEFVVWFKKTSVLWGLRAFFKRKTRCINGNFIQTVLSSANAAVSLFASLGRDGMERDPWVFFKAYLVLSHRPSGMFSSGSWDQYFVSKMTQNHRQRKDSTGDQIAKGLPVSDFCFKSLRKTGFPAPTQKYPHLQVKGFQ